jgi:hypothetical protein
MYIYHNEILFTHKEKEILLFCSEWMELEIVMSTEVSQVQKAKVIFSHVEDRSKVKCIHKYEHEYIAIYVMFAGGTRRRRERVKER